MKLRHDIGSFIDFVLQANAVGACLRYHCDVCNNKEFFAFCNDIVGVDRIRELVWGDKGVGLKECHPDVWYWAVKLLIEGGYISGDEDVALMRLFRKGYQCLVRIPRITSCELQHRRDPDNRELRFCEDCEGCLQNLDNGKWYCMESGHLSNRDGEIKPDDPTSKMFCEYAYRRGPMRSASLKHIESMAHMINKFYS